VHKRLVQGLLLQTH